MHGIGGVVARAPYWRRRAIAGLAAAMAPACAIAEGPVDLPSAFERAFGGVEACVALRDVAPGAGNAVSNAKACERRAPPCATFELAATVIALDRGVLGDANAAVKRNPPAEGDPQNGMSLREAFQKPAPWVYEEVSRRIGTEAFVKSLAAMRYGNAEAGGPVERIGAGEGEGGLTVSPPEQVEFLAKLKRGELPVSSESQARTVEIMPVEKIGDSSVASKTGACDGAAWVVGWVDRPQRSSVIFATVVTGVEPSADDVVARTKKLLAELGLAPPK